MKQYAMSNGTLALCYMALHDVKTQTEMGTNNSKALSPTNDKSMRQFEHES